MKNMIINGPYEVVKFAKKLAQTYNLNFIDPISISEEFLNNLVSLATFMMFNLIIIFNSIKFNRL